jgi:membrane associated rhomboid family serine protease/Zn-finger nucleic acid-binding protein
MYSCPECAVTMGRGVLPVGLFWSCPRCHGVWMSDLVAGRTRAADYLKGVWSGSIHRAGRRPCAVCARPMAVAKLRAPHGMEHLELDVCGSCRFIWFDPGEFNQLAGDEPPERAPDMPSNGWQYLFGFLGLPVEQEPPALVRRPWATWTLAGAVAAAFFLSLADLEGFIARFALIPADPWRLGGLTSLFSFFLHAGAFHLLGNLYFLVVFGDNVEDHLGIPKYLAMLLLATIAGDVAHVLLDPRSTIPVVGASGGISGVIAFYALAFPRARLAFLFFLFTWISIPAWGALVLWVLYQFVLVGMQVSGASHVSAAAHLGGAVVGVLFWAVWRSPAR